jgi:hypothetical protein
MKKPRPFGLLGDVSFADEDPSQALALGGGGGAALGSQSPNAQQGAPAL